MINRKFHTSILAGYIFILVVLVLLVQDAPSNISQNNNPHYSQLLQLNNKTAQILAQLSKTKYFKILRLKINSDCPLPFLNKLCKSKSCSVCRCDQKDIPQNWILTDRIGPSKFQTQNKEVWSNERNQSIEQLKWVWHVEDEENDQGEYFDVNTNIQSYSGYNGSYIWSLIYEENCFKGRNYYEQMCKQQKLFYQIISGLHTSISTHLSRFYKNITMLPQWADTAQQSTSFYFNQKEYQKRILDHPERVQNLLFLYQLLIKSVKSIGHKLHHYSIVSDNIADDLKATHLLGDFVRLIGQGGSGLGQLNSPNYGLFSNQTQQSNYLNNYLDNDQVKQYQRYIHNISRILNCVQCQKCKLFGKMQTYGLGTALKILLGYNQQLKRNQQVALINTLNKVSISVNIYFQYKNNTKKQDPYIYPKIWGFCGLTLIIFLWVISKWTAQKMNKKYHKIFKGTMNMISSINMNMISGINT